MRKEEAMLLMKKEEELISTVSQLRQRIGGTLMSGEKISGILRQAKRLVEVRPVSPGDVKSPDDAIWAVCRNEPTRIESNRLFYKAKAYVEQAGDFPNAIALAEKEEAK